MNKSHRERFKNLVLTRLPLTDKELDDMAPMLLIGIVLAVVVLALFISLLGVPYARS